MLTLLLAVAAHAGTPATVNGRLPGMSADDPDLPIINGEDATKADYPMTGGMLISGKYDNRYPIPPVLLCSSTLIAPDVVMLAAHCLDDDLLTQGQGTIDQKQVGWSRQANLAKYDASQDYGWPEDTVMAQDWVANSKFDIYTMQMGLAENYDIALLFLDTPVLDVPYAYLPTVDEATQIQPGVDVEIVGWGQQTDDSNPPKGTVGIKQMGDSTIDQISPYEIQIGTTDEARKCHGDSGGPTFMNVTTDSTEIMRVIGVTSHSYDQTDCQTKGGVDTRVDHYLDWIDNQMKKRCEDGSRVWCDEEGIPTLPPPPPPPEDTATDTGEGGHAKACGCSTEGGWQAGAVPALLALLALRRRRA